MLRTSLKRKLRKAGCKCAPFLLTEDAYPSCDVDGCRGPADVLLEGGDENGTVICVPHFLEHAKACKAGTKNNNETTETRSETPTPPAAPPPANPYHELARFLHEGGSEAYRNFERALREIVGCRECGGKMINPETGLCLVHDFIAAGCPGVPKESVPGSHRLRVSNC